MLRLDGVYEQEGQTVYRYLLSLTRSVELAEELTQETFYQAVKSAERYDGSCKVSTWLCAIAKNQLLAYNRKHPPTAELNEDAAVCAEPEGQVLATAERAALHKSLHRLDEPQREVLYLRLFGGLSFREIGDVFEKTENWARVTFYRGKEKLKKEIESHETEITL